MGQRAAMPVIRLVMTTLAAAMDGLPMQAAVVAIPGTVRTVLVALRMVTPTARGTRPTITVPPPTAGMTEAAIPAIAATASRAATATRTGTATPVVMAKAARRGIAIRVSTVSRAAAGGHGPTGPTMTMGTSHLTGVPAAGPRTAITAPTVIARALTTRTTVTGQRAARQAGTATSTGDRADRPAAAIAAAGTPRVIAAAPV